MFFPTSNQLEATHRRNIALIATAFALVLTLAVILVAVLSGQLALEFSRPFLELSLCLGPFPEDVILVRVVRLVTLQKPDVGVGEVVVLFEPGLRESQDLFSAGDNERRTRSSETATYVSLSGKLLIFGVDQNLLLVILFSLILDVPIFTRTSFDVL